ncbi:hypothetical protein B0H19DRAFT_1243299 [Mycena capillaripes]|nr:hypothetical protein B0H19DRAFT_1243299 [Mycena capillaripes]
MSRSTSTKNRSKGRQNLNFYQAISSAIKDPICKPAVLQVPSARLQINVSAQKYGSEFRNKHVGLSPKGLPGFHYWTTARDKPTPAGSVTCYRVSSPALLALNVLIHCARCSRGNSSPGPRSGRCFHAEPLLEENAGSGKPVGFPGQVGRERVAGRESSKPETRGLPPGTKHGIP